MSRPTVVAVPALDEADRIAGCLHALLTQSDLAGRPLPSDAFQVVVLANNCSDATAAVARGFGPRVHVHERIFAPEKANAGVARRAAMDAALQLLPPDGLICTTDADSRPRGDWIARLWSAITSGAEAVAGAVDFDPHEARLVFSPARAAEARYSALQAELVARIDPEPHDPWPNHIWAWGANLAVTAYAYRRVGGMPVRPLAEDRAFVEALRLHDVPVRHCLEARVWTSARLEGRAPGGLASLVADHSGADITPCDAALEPVRLVRRRAALRCEARAVRRGDAASGPLARRLHLESTEVEARLASATFGAGWAALETASPRLRPQRLLTADLPREILQAERLLERMYGRASTAEPARAHAATAGLWSSAA